MSATCIHEIKLEQRKVLGGHVYVAELGDYGHGRPEIAIVVHPSLVLEGALPLPAKARLEEIKRNRYAVYPDENCVLYGVTVYGGYRGDASASVSAISPGEITDVVKYHTLQSPKGSLGSHLHMLITVSPPSPIRVEWRRTGRLYGDAPSGVTIITPDGETYDGDYDSVVDEFVVKE